MFFGINLINRRRFKFFFLSSPNAFIECVRAARFRAMLELAGALWPTHSSVFNDTRDSNTNFSTFLYDLAIIVKQRQTERRNELESRQKKMSSLKIQWDQG